ncbi:MAG: purine-nucleoside phosphorylase [Verrucomicrobiota bacterium]
MDKENQALAGVEHIRETLGITSVHACIVMGSGWSQAAPLDQSESSIKYADIPGLGNPETQSHQGDLHLLKTNGRNILLFAGRRHLHEGAGWLPVCMPAIAAKQLSAPYLALTNSAGSINSKLQPGRIAIIDDHINMMGSNPLLDPAIQSAASTFPDQSQIYDPQLKNIMAEILSGLGHDPFRAVYLATTGPNYETPAEIRAFHTIGADLVGMSTVPEAIVANAAGIKVAAVSLVSNRAAGLSDHAISHREVMETAENTRPAMRHLLKGIIKAIAELSHE